MASAAKQSDFSLPKGAGPVLGAAAAGLAAGLLANLGRKAVVQGVSAAAGRWDQALTAEHEAVSKIFDLIEGTDESQAAKRTTLLTQLKHALGKHAFQEENVVYAALRANGLTEEADQLTAEHGYVKQALFDLTEMPRDDAGWLPRAQQFRDELDRHVREEEDEIFPKLVENLGEQGNAHVTAAMNKEGFKLA
jgi:iron-sulfur cluster repair protein YtfE (RIC family)